MSLLSHASTTYALDHVQRAGATDSRTPRDEKSARIRQTVWSANEVGSPDVFFVGTPAKFTGHILCTSDGFSGISALQFTVTPGEDPLLSGLGFLVQGQFVSRASVHPNSVGADLYSQALEDALARL